MRGHDILRVAAKALIPLILLFALYVQFHGDFGPGGGFQAGVIFAASIMLYGLIFGLNAAQRAFPPRLAEILGGVGVMIYGGTGVLTLFGGGNYLDYNALDHHHPVHGQHLGIMFVEMGVGLAVTAVMCSIFYAFAARRRSS